MISVWVLLSIHGVAGVDAVFRPPAQHPFPPTDTSGRPKRSIDYPWPEQSDRSRNAASISRIIVSLTKAYDIAYHYQNETGHLVNELVKDSKRPRAIVHLSNYESTSTGRKHRHVEIRKRSLVHVVLPGDAWKLSESHLQVAVLPGDFVLFIGETQHNDTLLRTAKTLSNKTFSLYNLEYSSRHVSLYEMCFFCGLLSGKFRLVTRRSCEDTSSIVDDTKKSIQTRSDDFGGHSFNVAFISAKLYFQCRNPEIFPLPNGATLSHCHRAWGVENEMLEELMKRMNFSVRFVTGPPVQDVGPWYKTILDINESYADWAVGGISFTEHRSKKVDFSVTFGNDPMKVVYAVPEDLFGTGIGIITAFSLDTWLMLIITMAIISIILRISFYFFPYEVNNSYTHGFLLAARMLVEQCAQTMNYLPTRWLLISWLMCCVIISTAYKAKISALMVHGRNRHPYVLSEMISMDYVAHLNQLDASMMLELLKSSTDASLQKLSHNTRNDLYICEAIKSTLTTKSMVIEEQNPLLFDFNNECYKELGLGELNRLKLTTDDLFPSGHAWPFRKNAPYLDTMNKHITLLFQSGLYDIWMEKYLKSGGGMLTSNGHGGFESDKIFSMKEFIGPITIWSLGIFVSMICLILEFSYYHTSLFLRWKPKFTIVFQK